MIIIPESKYVYHTGNPDKHLALGVEPGYLVSHTKNTLLVDAIEEGHHNKILKYLPVCDLNITNIYGNTALGLMVKNPKYWVYIPAMLELGANANISVSHAHSGKGVPLIDVYFEQYSNEYPKDPINYIETFKLLIKHTDMSQYCQQWGRHLINDLLNFFTFAPYLTKTTEEDNEKTLYATLSQYDFEAVDQKGNNALQEMILSLYLDDTLMRQALTQEPHTLKKIITHKNKEGHNALATYFDIFEKDISVEELTETPQSLCILFQTYLDILYPTFSHSKAWEEFMTAPMKSGATLQSVLNNGFYKLDLLALLDKHVLSLEIKPLPVDTPKPQSSPTFKL